MSNTEWSASSWDGGKYLGLFEFQNEKDGEWHNFKIVVTSERFVFGSFTNSCFLESGYMIREENETINEGLAELYDDLRTYYADGPNYVSRIVCNERM
jgi:hypothetical protein